VIQEKGVCVCFFDFCIVYDAVGGFLKVDSRINMLFFILHFMFHLV
jgi:hypothetical protein